MNYNSVKYSTLLTSHAPPAKFKKSRLREGATDLSRALTTSCSPRATPSWHRVLLSTSFGASLMVIPCWTSPLHGEGGGKFGNKGEERERDRDRDRESDRDRDRERERGGPVTSGGVV